MTETSALFLLLYISGLAFAILVRPIYGLYTYMAVFYLHPPSRWWGTHLPDLRWSLIAALVTLTAIVIRSKSEKTNDRPIWLSSPITKILILYTGWMWVQSLWVSSPWHFEGTILFSKYVLLLYLIYNIIDDEEKFAGFGFAHVLGCAYLGWLVFEAPGGGRLEGVGGPGIDNANTLGMHLSTGLIFAGFLLLVIPGWKRLLVIAAIPLILNGIIQTETRGALVGLAAGGIATIYLKPRKYRRAFYALSVVALIAFVSIANSAFIGRMATMNAALNEQVEWDHSARSRLEIVKAQIKMFTEYPFGYGHQGTTALSTSYLADEWLAQNSGNRASHNLIMAIAVDQGIPGLLLFFVLGYIVISELRSLKRLDDLDLPGRLGAYRAMIGGTLVAIFISGMFANYLKAEVLVWNLALMAILVNFGNKYRDTTKVKTIHKSDRHVKEGLNN